MFDFQWNGFLTPLHRRKCLEPKEPIESLLSWGLVIFFFSSHFCVLDQYNGVTYFDNKLPDHTVHLDASLAGMGATCANMVYALPISPHCRHLHITQLEMLNVVVALKL